MLIDKGDTVLKLMKMKNQDKSGINSMPIYIVHFSRFFPRARKYSKHAGT